MSVRPLLRYEPSALAQRLYERIFAHIEIDAAWERAVRDAAARGTVVYVLRNLSLVDFLALDTLTKRLELPQIRFANDLRSGLFDPMGRGLLRALRPRDPTEDAADLGRALLGGAPSALFLKRPATLLEPKARGKSEGDLLLRTVLDAQRSRSTPILLVPQVFVWTKAPDAAKQGPLDLLLGPREWPGQLRAIAQFAANHRRVTLRAGEPVDVAAFLAREGASAEGDSLVRRLTYVLLRRLERERKAVLGPRQKPADRLHAQVVRSPKLQKTIADLAASRAEPVAAHVLAERALAMLRELAAAPDPALVPPLDRAFAWIFERMYAGIEVDREGLERLREASREGTLVLLPSHKSHVDYLVLAQIFYRHRLPLPLVAAGDNLDFFPAGPVLRRAGAFFIRRSFHGDRLYAAVVDAYIRRLLKDGWPLEFFLEGGRSRTGKLLPPKVGLLSLVVDAALGVPERPVYFCPISIGYERLVEERSFVHELSGGEKQREDVRGLVASASAIAGRYGHLSVQFGEPLTLARVLAELSPGQGDVDVTRLTPARRRAMVTRLAHRVMNEINRVTAVTPGALVATALLSRGPGPVPHEALVATCERLERALWAYGARRSPALERAGAVTSAIHLFVRAGHVAVEGSGIVGAGASYAVPSEARLSLDLSKNALVHFFAARGLVATCLRSLPEAGPAPLDTVSDRVHALAKLLKFEFSFRADAPFAQVFADELETMARAGEIERASDAIAVRDPDAIALYAGVLRSFVEGYRVAARGLAPLARGPLAPKDLVRRAIPAGRRMVLEGEIERREAVSRPILENAYAAFVDHGYLRRVEGKLALVDAYVEGDAWRGIEGRIAALLWRPRGP